MIALPFHPSNAYTIEEVNENPEDILRLTEENCNAQMKEFGLKMDLRSKIEHGRLRVDQGVIAGLVRAEWFENISKAADILKGSSIGNDIFQLNVYPASQPVFQEVVEKGIASGLLEAGANLRSAFCGPCFGPVMSRLTADFQYAIQRGTSQTVKAPDQRAASLHRLH